MQQYRMGTLKKIWPVLVILALAAIVYLIIRRKNMQTVKAAAGNNNVQAFLMTIRKCEGTAGPDGYRTLFGGKLFTSYQSHPNVKVPFGNTYSTAAGAYQILFRTWETLRLRLSLPDFSPASQDMAAIELIREKNGALDDVIAGHLETAVSKVRSIWASLPGAGYGQPEKSIASVKQYYLNAGGTIA